MEFPTELMTTAEILTAFKTLGIDISEDEAEALRMADQFVDPRKCEEIAEDSTKWIDPETKPKDTDEPGQDHENPTSASEAGNIEELDDAEEIERGPALSGEGLLENPEEELARFRSAGGADELFVASYIESDSLIHILRTASQPAAVRPVLMAMRTPMAKQLCSEAGIVGLSAHMLAEAVVEARIDEAHYKALAGVALGNNEFDKAERLERLADRQATKMRKSLDQLHRLRRPAVSVKIGQASNVNLGSQTVNTDQGEDLKAKLGSTR